MANPVDAATDTSWNLNSRPIQIKSWKEKTPQWFKDNVNHFIAQSNFNFGHDSGQRKDTRVLYQVYNNEFPLAWFDHFTNPLNSTDEKYKKYPAKIRPLNILRTNIDLLLGEWPRRPFLYNVENLGESGYNRYMESMKETAQSTLTQYFQKAALEAAQAGGRQLSEEEMQQLQQDPPIPEEVKAEFESSYKDIIAIKGQKWLKRIIREQEIKRKMHRMFKDWLISGETYSYKAIENGRLIYNKINPLNIDYSKSDNQDFLEDGEWVVHRELLTISDITDKFYPLMSQQNHEALERRPFMRSAGDFFGYLGSLSGASTLGSRGKIPVYHVQWKGKKKIGFLTYFDMDTFQMVEDVVDENYIIDRDKGEQIEWRWVNEVYEGWRIGQMTDDLFFGLDACAHQRNQMNNHSSCKLSYNGRKYSDTNSTNISVLEMGLPYNIMFILTGYTLEKTLAKSKGKIILLDENTIPNDEDWSEEQFFYYAESRGYALINRNQEGVDKTWNQYQVLDMGLFDQIKELINLQNYFKEQWDDIIGINRQRKGQTYSSDGQGVNERAAFQSTVITDMIFIGFEEYQERELQGLMDLGKFATAEGVYGTWNRDDYGTSVFEINPEDFANEDMGVFVDNSSEHMEKLQKMQNLAQAMIQNNHKASAVLEVIDGINIAELKQKLRHLEAIDAELAAQTQQSEAEMAAAMDERKKMFMEFEKLLDREFMEAKEDRLDDREYIKGSFNTFTFADGDSNDNGVPDATEVQKLVDARNKFMLEYQDKVAGRGQKQQEIEMKKAQLQHTIKMDKENLKLGYKKDATARMKAKQRPAAKKK